jgi:Lrp/AsnC family transcriptional regulator for asnA, asnC and gidA
MDQLDLKDRKILYQLNLNCRQSNTQIGKIVGLSKQVVDYRIKKLEEKSIITGYQTVINSFKLGFDVYRYYVSFQNATQKTKDEMVDFLTKYKNMWSVYSATGLFDLGILIWVKDLKNFQLFWEEFNDTYGDYVSDKIYSVLLYLNTYSHTYLLPDSYDISDRKKFIQIGPEPAADIDHLDYDLLNIIVLNARKPIVEIAKQLNCSSQTVNYRLKNLMNKGIIKSCKPSIDYSKLNLHQMGLGLWLRKLSNRRKIWEYIGENPQVTSIETCAGYADLQIELILDSLDTLEDFMTEVSEKFQDSIKNYNFFTLKHQYLFRCLPDMKVK